LFKDEFP